jgi:phosphohistidine phosphatase
MAIAARGMRNLRVRIDLALTSPFLRAEETARIVVAALRPRPPLRSCQALAPGGSPVATLADLSGDLRTERLLLVGHEPDLSRLAAYLLLGERDDLGLEFRKGALARIDFSGAAEPGKGNLAWLLQPKVLRRLGRRLE